MRCFIAREYNVSTDIICSIDDVLDELQIEKVDIYSAEVGTNIETSIMNVILSADFIIAIISSTSQNVLFEVGLAVGSGKPVFLLVEENNALPFDLKGMTYIKINEKLKDNMLLPLKYFMENRIKTRNLVLVTKRESVESEIEEKQFFDKLQDIKMNGNGMQFEKFVIEFFQQIEKQYTTSKFAIDSRDMDYDLAIWIDELEDKIINPVVFDLKFGKIEQNRIEEIAKKAMVSANNGQTVIVLYCDTQNKTIVCANKYPGVMIVQFEKFVHSIFKFGLSKSILLLRNSIAHGKEF